MIMIGSLMLFWDFHRMFQHEFSGGIVCLYIFFYLVDFSLIYFGIKGLKED